ncbi:MAG: pirin family protein [Flavisolibacter sp.]|jgi:redox-sensitive bicupin YhaK (pirin superfamily)|nr:pirin family protein [Flavisolibacter sp.]
MNTVIHKADSRGLADHGWLKSFHTFSFAGYHDPSRMHFGLLRVLNDDSVAPGMGFGKHPHDNMEIISIPLDGALEHSDSMGNVAVIKKGDVQVMSAGTGVVHSEKNHSDAAEVKFLQIWVFPNKKNVKPRYDQQTFPEDAIKNQLVTIVAPMGNTEGVNIHQDAWFSLGSLDKGTQINYSLHKKDNGLYALILEGDVKINDTILNRRDGVGISIPEDVSIEAINDARILLMEVPMTLP